MKYYIQSKEGRILYTCAEFDTREKANEMLKEYRKAYHWKHYYVSTRCCKNWKHDKAMIEFVKKDNEDASMHSQK